MWVIKNSANFAFWVDDKDGTDGVSVMVFTWMDETKLAGNEASVSNDWELDFNIEVLLDPFSPLDVGEDLVNGKTEKLSIHLAEFSVILLEGNEFGGADRGKVGRVTK